MRIRPLLPMLCAAALACSDSDGGPAGPTDSGGTPATLQATNNTDLTAAAGETVDVSVRVRDQAGAPVSGVAVQFQVIAGGGSAPSSATTDGNGTASVEWTLGTQVGENVLVATLQGLPPVEFDASTHAGPPALVDIFIGQDQVGPVGVTLPYGAAVIVTDQFGNRVGDVPVEWVVTGGGGTLLSADTRTSAGGSVFAQAWRLGPEPGVNTLELRVEGIEQATVFQATGFEVDSPFDLEIRYEHENDFTAEQRASIAAAVTKIRSFMTAAPPAVEVDFDSVPCHEVTLPAISGSITNPIVHVYARSFSSEPEFEPFESFVAIAGVCLYRIIRPDPDYRTAVASRMIVNLDLAEAFASAGLFERYVLHELIHAVGFGGIWNASSADGLRDLVQGRGTSDPRFIGARAVSGYGVLPGNTEGAVAVPVDATGSATSTNGHWRKTLFLAEAMMPAPDASGAPVSGVTVGALADVGYEVDLGRSDPALVIGPGSQAPVFGTGLRSNLQSGLGSGLGGHPLPSGTEGHTASDVLPAAGAVDVVTGELLPSPRR